jgi:hypothetical protein
MQDVPLSTQLKAITSTAYFSKYLIVSKFTCKTAKITEEELCICLNKKQLRTPGALSCCRWYLKTLPDV